MQFKGTPTIPKGAIFGEVSRVGGYLNAMTSTDWTAYFETIPADKLDRIFDPFVQLNRGYSSGHEGTGLGLAISRDLARAMRGDICLRSEEGVGSTFTLILPRF